MTQIQGIGVGRGIATGPVLTMPEPLSEPVVAPRTRDAADEKQLVLDALHAVAADLAERAKLAGGDAQAVLEAQAMMAQDPGLIEGVDERIDEGSTGERAVFDAFEAYREMLVGLGGYMAERAADLSDVSQRIVAHLRGVPAPGVPESDTPFILVARDLAPADTALLDLERVLALVTVEGGPTSHTAILARSRSIPAVVGVESAGSLSDGTVVIVDAASGTITVEPTAADLDAAETRTAELQKIASAPITDGALADGHAVPLLANLGKPSEAKAAVELGAEGVGLFRTEFLFLGSTSAPTVAQQREAYTELLSAFPGKKVVVRALDAGSDKPLAFLNDAEEENPALGLRGLRALRAKEDILREQLTALAEAQAATSADLWVMAPMVADAEEAEYFVSLAKELGIRVAGVMAEVPSLALMAPEVTAVSDFVSIGTNDLTQYTLAADRLLGSVANYQDPWHPAVLRLIKLLGDAGRAAGKPVGVCGEAAADPALAVVLVGLGVTTLSMTPAALADVRAELARTTLEQATARAAAALRTSTAAAARSAAASVD
ncbi:phosphotransferase system enzyme I (PtsI) [Microbacteriaceae bacterium SG_E_30_P1]|uniref:Phosphoenolpyruvate-protein phosphotransferase n=1 Tax=Antiquaquibacter oligotrophicus TaxID=2880260 RepID=A0ABT6KP50_9MICO|nr:phosphoenolpyruvate--protein phosphotransferase [Antiquaquibacter oligotrophicus]MDH6181771.1 phosphotransferase system enzyme I (PtsI) [Antiquaquibacter oligotrophicus]UDF12548.1 phosphoenolpyruvate--protein phosphotransferase [Antiquaquibacter oligotrophicus]